MPQPKKVLFLCTGNSCRSQMAEAILRHVGGDRFEALSAGSHPARYVHPLALQAMRCMNIGIEDTARSKSWDEFADHAVDLIITVCDAAADAQCPVWPGTPLTAHWSLPDPTYHPGTAEERVEFAMRIAKRLRLKIEALVRLDWTVAPVELKQRLDFLGEI